MLGTNGGGFFNANSAHPFENPTPLSNPLEMLSIFVIPAGLTYTLGRMTGSQRHGWAVWAAMAFLFLCGVTTAYWAEARGNPLLKGADQQVSAAQPAATWKAKKSASALRTLLCLPLSRPTPVAERSTAGTILHAARRNGSAGQHHAQRNVFGGVGAGLYGILIYVVLAVFIAGLMVGRTPEYLGKKIEAYDVKMAMLVTLVFPLVILVVHRGSSLGAGIRHLEPSSNPGPHGFTPDSLRLHLQAWQQRLRFRRAQRETRSGTTRRGRNDHADRPVPDDYSHAGDRRQSGEKEIGSAIAGNISGDHAAVHRASGRRDGDCGRAYIFPGAEPGTSL